MAITPTPRTRPSLPWQAPWYRPPTPVGSGRTNAPLPPPGRPDLPAPLSPGGMSQTPDGTLRGPQMDYNMQWPTEPWRPPMQQFGSPWFGQPLLPHQVPIHAMPNPWMTNPDLPFQYQQPTQTPWWQPPTYPEDRGWKGVEAMPQAYNYNAPPMGEAVGRALPMDLLPSTPPPTPPQLYPSPTTLRAAPPDPIEPWRAPWYGWGLWQ